MAKPASRSQYLEVVYDAERWSLLKTLREKAVQIMDALNRAHLESIAHGSLAKGDVGPRSDIDIFLLSQASSFNVETALEKAGINVSQRVLLEPRRPTRSKLTFR